MAHCGTTTAGASLVTLDVVDVATGWTECVGVSNGVGTKGQAAVCAALERARARFPFPCLGIDSDNGAECLNAHLIRSCQQEQLTFTRCRASHKHDQAHVEAKNGSVVRREVGYDRDEGEAALAHLNRVDDLVRVAVTGWLPVLKLVAKEREGAKVRQRDDDPRTPFHRAVAAGVVPAAARQAFATLRQAQGPLALRRQVDTALERRWALRVGADGHAIGRPALAATA
ncbi:MAG: DDE-type integrase/transposase/recombinase [Chloroflexi bacterium]|nr:DDE-type integrase/transposase/recombinase [Chloroflexota bacterium]